MPQTTPQAALPAGMGRWLQRALSQYERGDLPAAENACRQVLQLKPNQADALHLLGLVAWRRGDRTVALAHVRQAIAGDPRKPQPHNSLGVMLRESGDLPAAEQALRTALALAPDHVEALTNLGNVLGESGRLAEAETLHLRAIERAPAYADGHNNLGTVLFKAERWEEAVAACRRAVGLQPTRAEFHLNLGNALLAAEDWAEAAAALRQAAALAPALADVHAGLGVALHRLELLDESASAHRRSVQLQPGNARFWSNLSYVEVDRGDADAALTCCRKGLALDPDLPELHNSLGLALKLQDRLPEALAAYRKAIELRPTYAKAYNNLGVALHDDGCFQDALAAYEKAIELDPDYTTAFWNRGISHLLLGNLAAGWRDYEHGLAMKKGRATRRHENHPPWQGESVTGKVLLAWSEQGVGDQIMFAGLLPDLLAAGARCIVEADPRLAPLFLRSWKQLEFIPLSETSAGQIRMREVDAQAPLGGLCRWLRPDRESFPVRHGYLRADPERSASLRRRYRERLGARPLVGISWRGGTGDAVRVRSIPLPGWAPILRTGAFGFVNLQYGDCRADLAAAERETGVPVLHDDTVDPLGSLDDFAAQVAAMDLVVSVDNTTVHMAGALDVPVWVLLPAVPDWRWLLGREDSPWYASVRLFRQATRGDWRPVIARVAGALTRFAPRA
jgi:Flp pilus assembly protein TadD